MARAIGLHIRQLLEQADAEHYSLVGVAAVTSEGEQVQATVTALR
jgi:hypothetical protein